MEPTGDAGAIDRKRSPEELVRRWRAIKHSNDEQLCLAVADYRGFVVADVDLSTTVERLDSDADPFFRKWNPARRSALRVLDDQTEVMAFNWFVLCWLSAQEASKDAREGQQVLSPWIECLLGVPPAPSFGAGVEAARHHVDQINEVVRRLIWDHLSHLHGLLLTTLREALDGEPFAGLRSLTLTGEKPDGRSTTIVLNGIPIRLPNKQHGILLNLAAAKLFRADRQAKGKELGHRKTRKRLLDELAKLMEPGDGIEPKPVLREGDALELNIDRAAIFVDWSVLARTLSEDVRAALREIGAPVPK